MPGADLSLTIPVMLTSILPSCFHFLLKVPLFNAFACCFQAVISYISDGSHPWGRLESQQHLGAQRKLGSVFQLRPITATHSFSIYFGVCVKCCFGLSSQASGKHVISQRYCPHKECILVGLAFQTGAWFNPGDWSFVFLCGKLLPRWTSGYVMVKCPKQ